jgi:hypothetical protein
MFSCSTERLADRSISTLQLFRDTKDKARRKALLCLKFWNEAPIGKVTYAVKRTNDAMQQIIFGQANPGYARE